ncbi:integral membrane protein 2B [Hylaeus anthracinus]|uniref:integral membrane protein 2B n=1 Tax=Hylaeus volcanicus TaxID=313075 RepID=UPI0023B879D7|nr:integral membrane protein 2B [Hylaeus volcanicus]XP_053978460.1 integral membrane protein 2B [Hylaeus volcanicus]XP_053978461.1 integral membrane protein 2B [Hylaeus volcanicus]XP_054014808.1 integral membrane protein 2B [Hylaeus anthracinus]XP_054014809.1 integral membrane protein 2B [Hylaeus anthracinus]
MTVITKPITEKADKVEQPLFVELNVPDDTKKDPEAQLQNNGVGGHYLVSRRNMRRLHVTATIMLFLVALMILIIGIIGGLYIYRKCARTQMHIFRTGWYTIPYESSNKGLNTNNGVHQALSADSDFFKNLEKIEKNVDSELRRGSFFKERFEIDLENEDYERIDVPDFRGGRQGRFIHDFNINKTGIIDIDGQCCFVMPLNRQRVLPPRNMYDLLRKMYNGYYEVDTEIVRETMKVIVPPISDLSVVGTYIARECQDLPTYMLTKVNSNVVKRSISSGVFGQYAGLNIIEFDILNLDDVNAYKKSSKI